MMHTSPDAANRPCFRRPGRKPGARDYSRALAGGIDPARLQAADRALEAAGVSIRQWARANGFSHRSVEDVLAGRSACLFGASHRIAVALGVKDDDVLHEDSLAGWKPALNSNPVGETEQPAADPATAPVTAPATAGAE